MGLIKAGLGAAGGIMADQWKEFFYCDALEANVLVAKGQKKTSKRSSNAKGEENIISNGSTISVNDGQCMIIVEQGKIVEFCAEPGQFVWNASTEPSIFEGSLGGNIRKTFLQVGKRFTYGGDTGKDQRIYYFNTKEILGNKYGTANPFPFRIVDKNIGFDSDISIRCNGEYSYKIIDPMLFYTNVCGNIDNIYERDNIDSMLKTEILTALQPAFAKIAEMGIRYSSLLGHTIEIADSLNEVLSKKWIQTRGIQIASFGINSITISPEDEKMIKDLQKLAVYKNAGMAGAGLVDAQVEAMKNAAKNENGAIMGFMGMNMAQQTGSNMNAQNFFQMAQQQQQNSNNQFNNQFENNNMVNQGNENSFNKIQNTTNNSVGMWTCSCGATNKGKFCADCGKPKPISNDNGWTCSCGVFNSGKFCSECGAKKPQSVSLYRCDKCGWEPKDPAHPPKFCPECGDPFNDEDIK